MLTRLAWGVALLGALGCGEDQSETKAPPPKPPDEPAPSCAEQTAELGAWLQRLVAEGPVRGGAAKLVAVDRPPGAFDAAPSVVIAADAVSFNGNPVADPRAVARHMQRYLAAERAQIESAGLEMDRLLVLVAPDATWINVVDVAAAAATTGFTRLVFVFDAKSDLAPPPTSSISAELAALARGADPAGPAVRLADGIPADGGLPGKVYGACKPVVDWLPTLVDVEPGARNARVAAELPGKIAECDCRIELAAVKALHWSGMGRDLGPPQTAVAVALAPRGAKNPTEVTAAGHEAWSAAHQVVLDAPAEPLRLKAR
jgi:hypothetical protein